MYSFHSTIIDISKKCIILLTGDAGILPASRGETMSSKPLVSMDEPLVRLIFQICKGLNQAWTWDKFYAETLEGRLHKMRSARIWRYPDDSSGSRGMRPAICHFLPEWGWDRIISGSSRNGYLTWTIFNMRYLIISIHPKERNLGMLIEWDPYSDYSISIQRPVHASDKDLLFLERILQSVAGSPGISTPREEMTRSFMTQASYKAFHERLKRRRDFYLNRGGCQEIPKTY